MLDEQQRV